MTDKIKNHCDFLFYLIIPKVESDSGKEHQKVCPRSERHIKFNFKNASAFLPRRAWCEAPSFLRGCDPPEAFYLSGGLKPATETSRILTYPPLIEAWGFPTEINTPAMTVLLSWFSSSCYLQFTMHKDIIRDALSR